MKEMNAYRIILGTKQLWITNQNSFQSTNSREKSSSVLCQTDVANYSWNANMVKLLQQEQKNGCFKTSQELGKLPPVLEFMRVREPGLQAPNNLAGFKIENANNFFPYYFFLRYMISNIRRSTDHVSCLNCDRKALQPTNLKLVE